MFENLTERARQVMAFANQEAQRFNHEYIGTEHILLGLVKEGSGKGVDVLKNLKVDPCKVRSETEKLLKSGPEQITPGKLPKTPRAKKVIEYAIEEAKALEHKVIGTEHLLLGLLREQDGVAAQVLMNLNLRLEDVREEVLNLFGASEKSEEAKTVLSLPPPAVAILESTILVKSGGLITKNFPFSELRAVEFSIGSREIRTTPQLAACLIAASQAKPSGYSTALVVNDFLEFMKRD